MATPEKEAPAGPGDRPREIDPGLLLEAWFSHVGTLWAVKAIDRLAAEDPERFLSLGREMVKRSRGESELFAFGERALEIFLMRHGEKYLDRLADEASALPGWRTAVLAVELGRLTPELSSRVRLKFDIITEGTTE